MHDPQEAFVEEIEEGVGRIMADIGYSGEWVLEVPPEGMGFRALPCFPLASALKKAPGEIASDIAGRYSGDMTISETAGPYVNFSIGGTALGRKTLECLEGMGPRYGSLPSTGMSILLEHTSANPNGPLHVGRTRNPIIGDTMARILRFAGDDVTTEYYVNDVGKQVAILVWGTDNAPSDLPPAETDKADHVRVRAYQWANSRMEDDPAVASEIESLIDGVEAGDAGTISHFAGIVKPVLDGMLQSLARLNITYDSFINESQFIVNGDVVDVVNGLKKSPIAAEEDGAWFLDMEGLVHGRSTKFVFARSSGTSLYTTRDIAYHKDKLARAEALIDILGEDHKLQATQLGHALGELGEERRPEVVFYSFVSLPEGKMSTRKGVVVYMDDLIDEAVELAREEVESRRPDIDETKKAEIAEAVGVGAIRYNMIRVQSEKKIVFKWEEALNFDGDSAPFAQYAFARASSIIAKGGKDVSWKVFEPDNEEARFLEVISRFPSVVRDCAETRRPYRMAGYVHDVAVAFNQFYRDCKVIGSDREEERLVLVKAARTVLGNGLDLLGIPHPDQI